MSEEDITTFEPEGSLDELLGGPMSALIDAQKQSSISAIEYILSLTDKPESIQKFQEGKEIPPLSLQKAQFGFQRTELDDDGKFRTRDYSLNVPVVSLSPVPYLAIHKAKIDYKFEIFGIKRNKKSSQSENRDRSFFSGRQIFAKYSSISEDEKSSQANFSIQVEISQNQMPGGLSKFLGITSDSVTQGKGIRDPKQLNSAINLINKWEVLMEDTYKDISIPEGIFKKYGQDAKIYFNYDTTGTRDKLPILEYANNKITIDEKFLIQNKDTIGNWNNFIEYGNAINSPFELLNVLRSTTDKSEQIFNIPPKVRSKFGIKKIWWEWTFNNIPLKQFPTMLLEQNEKQQLTVETLNEIKHESGIDSWEEFLGDI